MTETLRLPYKQPGRWAKIVPFIAIVFALLIMVGRNELCLVEADSIPPSQRACYGLNLLFAFIFGSAGVYGLFSRKTMPIYKRQVIIDKDSISAPEQGAFQRVKKMRFADIVYVDVFYSENGEDKAIDIRGSSGRMIIPKSRLQCNEDFAWLHKRLSTSMSAVISSTESIG